jgi:hypothetical protein
MLPTKKHSLTPANQTLATLFKPHLNNLASQTPANTAFKLTDPPSPPLKHLQQPSIVPVTLSLPRPMHHTRNVQNNKHPSNTTFPTFAPSKFFFELFPAWLDYHDLKKTFSKIGPVTNLFVSGKKTSQGRRFGFVSFLSILKEPEICDSLIHTKFMQTQSDFKNLQMKKNQTLL